MKYCCLGYRQWLQQGRASPLPAAHCGQRLSSGYPAALRARRAEQMAPGALLHCALRSGKTQHPNIEIVLGVQLKNGHIN